MSNAKTDVTALFAIGYGLYLVSAGENGGHNGLIVNAVVQVTDTPCRVAVTIHRSSYTHEIVSRTGEMCVSCLHTETPFEVFRHFGMQSGRETDKFRDISYTQTVGGLPILEAYSNAYFGLRVEKTVDLDTHTMFICTVEEAARLCDLPTMTYAEYHRRVKPQGKPAVRGYVCRICGYVYEGEVLPKDFVCPLCKHGAADFEPLSP